MQSQSHRRTPDEFNVDDCRTTYEDLRARGVEFVMEPVAVRTASRP